MTSDTGTTDTVDGGATDPAPVTDGFTPLRVSAIEYDTDDSVVVTFDPGDRRVRFEHGQHLTLRHEFDGIELRRSYSICSRAPDGPLRVAIRRVPQGVFSTWASTELRVGDEIDALPPLGHFTHRIDPTRARTYTALAAGSGITPILSIVSTILAAEPESRVSLVYVNRTSLSAMLLDELHAVRDRHLGRLAITFAFTREESGGELLSGRPDRERIDDWITAGILPTDVDHAFLCGPLEMTNDARDALIAAGLPAEQIHREVFTTKQQGTAVLAPQEITDDSVVIANGRATLQGRTSTFELYEGDSVLDAVQRVRPDAPFSCRSGVCSTCQAVVRSGEVEMAVNYGLTDDEVARGYVLTCQSRPVTADVDVDFDA
jgi:ring-1,2-phenylacetyl-CoA epoxidase subunit PaaE